MTLPRITVVTPSYNQAQFIEDTIKSVLDQQYPNLEYIIIDGGSTDGSQGIIRKYESSLAYWVSEPDQGQTDALIKGFNMATGDIMCWLNSDDLFEPRALWEVARSFEEHPEADMIYGDATWITSNGRLVKRKKEHGFIRFIWMYDHNFIPQPSTFWRSRLYWQSGGLDPKYDLAMDADLWAKFAERTKPVHIRRSWSRLRLYAEQKNQRLRARSDEEDADIRSRYLPQQPKWLVYSKKVVAKCLRISIKLLEGCYW